MVLVAIIEASHPSRGAWIEIPAVRPYWGNRSRRTPRGVRGLKFWYRLISIRMFTVAPLAGCVD